MSVHQLGGTDYKAGEIYRQTMAHSSRPLYAHADASGNCWLLSPSKAAPTRESLIAAFMSIPTYFPTIDARGWAVEGEAHWPTLDQATRSVDAALGTPQEKAA